MSSSRRIRATIFAGAIASVSALVLSAPAASAAASANACPSNTFCLFQNTNFSGNVYEFPVGSGRVCDFNKLDHGIDNSASSMINNTGEKVTLYADEGNCTGTRYDAQPHSVDSTFSNNKFNDRASGLSMG